MEFLRRIWSQLVGIWQGMSTWRRVLLVAVGLLSLAGIGLIAFLSLRQNYGSSRSRVGTFHSFGSIQVRIFRRRYSSSRKP